MQAGFQCHNAHNVVQVRFLILCKIESSRNCSNKTKRNLLNIWQNSSIPFYSLRHTCRIQSSCNAIRLMTHNYCIMLRRFRGQKQFQVQLTLIYKSPKPFKAVYRSQDRFDFTQLRLFEIVISSFYHYPWRNLPILAVKCDCQSFYRRVKKKAGQIYQHSILNGFYVLG